MRTEGLLAQVPERTLRKRRPLPVLVTYWWGCGGAVPRKPLCKPSREVLPGAPCPFLLAGFLFSAQPLQSSLPVKSRPADLNPEPATASSVGAAGKPDGSSPFECLIDSHLFSIPWPTQLRPQLARPPVSPLHSISRVLLHPELTLPLSSSRALRGFPVPSEESQPVSEALLGLECACLASPSTRPLAPATFQPVSAPGTILPGPPPLHGLFSLLSRPFPFNLLGKLLLTPHSPGPNTSSSLFIS